MVFSFDSHNNLVNPAESDKTPGPENLLPSRTYKPVNEELRKQLADFKEREKLSGKELAQMLGVHPTAVTKYLNNKVDGDITRIENCAPDVIRNAELLRSIKHEIVEGEFYRRFSSNLEMVRRTNDMAGITGEAGIGKSECAKLYVRKHPNCVMITATAWRRDKRSIEGLLWNSVTTGGWERGTQARGEFLVEKFKGSNRLIVVDNAHRLTLTGLAFFFDFHDETECPVAFLGNPEFLQRIERNDQMFSRLGLFRRIEFDDEQALVDHLLAVFVGKGHRALRSLALQVIKEKGHARSLKKQLQLTRELMERKPDSDLVKCFRAAHTHLVRNYKLED